MELFFTKNIQGKTALFDPQESKHCIKVLRYRKGDAISFIDGMGTLFNGIITGDSPGGCIAEINESYEHWKEQGYYLHMAVAPVKNPERYEWFMEKATEFGFDRLTPVVGQYSERKKINTERSERILLSATKQSLKARVPLLDGVTDVKSFILSVENFKGLKLIGHCHPGEKTELLKVLLENKKSSYIVLIGPEGDFSQEEVDFAVSKGFVPITLGESRLRVETAALCAVTGIYLINI
ncbi:MAG: RsmE family RNA methyltransferase [Bacteroidales bacterium]|nr:RsmE family RNA methyltransferase [Bacteroidales bacterium]MDD3990438.1 RsmE family RNA methyltransferase [Bacteroidales bacterium]